MAFADKKGIVVASPFKLQAESMLDVRQQVDTITERNELVTIKAATAGLRVYVKETKKSYVYNGTSWDELSVGNASLIVKLNSGTSEGINMFTYNGTTNKTINITAAGIGAAGKTHNHTKSEITDFPTSLKNPQALKFTGAASASYDGSSAVTVNIPTTSKTTKSLIVTLNGGTTEGTNKFTFDGSAEKSINITPSTIGAAASTHTHNVSQVTGLTANRALISDANGHPAVSAVTSTELGYLDGVTSNIQTQLNGKAASTHTHNYAGSSSAGGSANSAVKLATARKINGTSFDGTKDINIQNNYFDSLSGKDLNSCRTYGEYYGAGGNDCTNRPSGVDSFYLKIFRNASGYTAQSLYSVGVWYSRYYDGSSWSTWSKQYSSTSKPTASEIGAASSSHTHTKSQITDFPTSLKNPNALTFAGAVTGTYDGSKAVTINIPTTGATTKSSLTIQLNGGTTEGTNKFTFNGGTAKTINITPASIGAAAASHGTHVTYGTSAPKANGTASAGSATSVSRSDHVHPLQTTVSGNAGSATKLATARSIRTNLASTTAASFNGTADITPGITGTLPISHGGTGATTAMAANYNILKDTQSIADGWSDNTAIAFISASPNTTQGALRKYKAIDMWNDWLNTKVGASYAPKSHTHSYLPLSGGTVTGNVILKKGSYVHSAMGTSGTAGYVDIATIKISAQHVNVPIAFEIYRRRQTQPTKLYLTFTSGETVDPAVDELLFEGAGATDDFAVAKTATSTWHLYIKKAESYDSIAITEYYTNFSYMAGVAITWTNTHARALPSSGVTKATKITNASSTPNSLTIQFNGTTKATFNGGAAATVNITPDAIGAAAKSHGTHVTYGTSAPKANGTASAGSASSVSRSDHVHPAQTTVSGNAGSATKLATARTIDGVSFNGTANITHYGTCSTAASTAAKVVSCTGFTLATGAKITVKFTVTNTASNPTLNVNSTGAKAIQYRGSAISSGYLAANRVYTFIYDGTNYQLIGDINTDTNTTYGTGTATTAGLTRLYTSTGSATNGTMTQKAITDALAGKSSSSHTHNYAGSSSVGGAANSAVKLTTARTINGTSFDGTKNITLNAMYAEDLSNKNVSLNTYNLSSGTPKVKYYFCPTDGNGDGITGRPDDAKKNAFFLICESVRFASATDYITKQTYIHGATKITWERYCTNGTWSAWGERYTSQNKPTASEIGAASSSHTHNYAGSSSAGGAANSANRLNGISLTGGSGATTGYRLIATVKINAWGNYRGVFAVNSRHTGAGLLCISVGCNNSPVSFANGYSEIMYFGPVSSGSIISSDSFLVHMSSDGTKAYIFWKFSDYNTTTIVTLDSDFAISNGTWMTSISTSTYGKRKATTTINPSSAHNHSADNITSGTLPVARGGTGATTALAANYNILKDTPSITDGWSDDTYIAFISSTPNTTQGALRKYKAGNVWSHWLNSKISASYAAKSHTHNYAGSSSAGGAANSANKVPVPVGTVLFATSSTTTFFNACFGGTWEIVGNIDAIYGSSKLTLYMFRKTAA